MNFTLTNDKPQPKKAPIDAPPPGKQLRMFGGLDRPAGTRDLFDVDGCSKHPPAHGEKPFLGVDRVLAGEKPV